MNQNELRIGNIVNAVSYSYSGKKSYKEILVSIRSMIDAANLEPIELTEDRLLKLGFERTYDTMADYQYTFHRGKFILNLEFVLMDIDIHVKIKFVHQLQNLYFALTGVELQLSST